jgi:hypothetical protein
MAGERAEQMMRVAARAAVRNLRVLKRIEDSYGDVYGGNPAPDHEELMYRLEHNDIEAIAQALPSLIREASMTEEQA